LSSPVSLNISLSGVTVAAFDAEGNLFIGSGSNGTIYAVDLSSAPYVASPIASGNDISGGDITFAGEDLLLAAKPEGRLYRVMPGMANPQLAFVDGEVTGMATLEDDNSIIVSSRNNGQFLVYGGDDYAQTAAYDAVLEGEPFTLENGDMAAGCSASEPVEEGCQNFEIYLSANASQGGDIYRVTLDAENSLASLEPVLENLGDPHIALDGETGILYIVRGQGTLASYDPSTDVLSSFVNIATDAANVNQTYAALVTTDGKLLVGSASSNKVYEVDPATGNATNPIDVPVNGGDLVQTADGDVWLINRGENRFYNITDGVSQFDVDEFDEIYGAAILEDGLILIGDAGNSLKVVDPSIPGAAAQTYDLGINITAGDLASACLDSEDVIEPGECNAIEVLEYVPGTTNNGGALMANRTDANQALGEPEGTDAMVFVTLGYGGHITLGFGGLVQNLDGDDIEIVETSFGNPGCAAYPEFADVYVSEDGVNFVFAETVCKSDNLVDISSAGIAGGVVAVKIVNNDELTSTPDGFDLDGVRAIHNCEPDNVEEDPFCTNETVFVDESDNIIRLTAMGWYQECSGEYGMRWRIRNGSDNAIQAFFNYAGAPELQGPFNLEAGQAVYFTPEFAEAPNYSRTMRVFVDGEQVQVKAHGGAIKDLADCLPGGCPDDEEGDEAPAIEMQSNLTTFPNPTAGPAVIEFAPATTDRAIVEIFDMSGRPVEVLFNQEVQSGETYRIDFDGTYLPNGIYLVKFNTGSETVIDKIMIAR
jgi:hypothetical protein